MSARGATVESETQVMWLLSQPRVDRITIHLVPVLSTSMNVVDTVTRPVILAQGWIDISNIGRSIGSPFTLNK